MYHIQFMIVIYGNMNKNQLNQIPSEDNGNVAHKTVKETDNPWKFTAKPHTFMHSENFMKNI